jgi:hypothetical protein
MRVGRLIAIKHILQEHAIMKKFIVPTLSLCAILLIPSISPADGLNHEQWNAYCKTHKERCEKATRICEQNDNADCDQVKVSFMLSREIPASALNGKPKPKTDGDKK